MKRNGNDVISYRDRVSESERNKDRKDRKEM